MHPDAKGDYHTAVKGTGLQDYKTAAHAVRYYFGRGLLLL